MMRARNFTSGFSLVELSVVLIIISIITGSLLSIATSRIEADKIRETEATMDKLEAAFALYVRQNKRIPCPADAALAATHANFGIATRNVTPYYCDGTTGGWYWSGGLSGVDLGSIPFKELKIADEYAYDAWGRRITYLMIETCNTNTTDDATFNFSSTTQCGAAGSTAMEIKDAAGSTITHNAILVLLSHGANGHGAYPHDGGTTRINYYNGAAIDADELNNSDMLSNGASQSTNGIYIQKSKTLTFDDIVRYKTKSQLIKDAGALTSDSTSISTSSSLCNIVNATSGQIADSTAATNICGTNPGNSNCATYLSALATQVRNLCFY